MEFNIRSQSIHLFLFLLLFFWTKTSISNKKSLNVEILKKIGFKMKFSLSLLNVGLIVFWSLKEHLFSPYSYPHLKLTNWLLCISFSIHLFTCEFDFKFTFVFCPFFLLKKKKKLVPATLLCLWKTNEKYLENLSLWNVSKFDKKLISLKSTRFC